MIIITENRTRYYEIWIKRSQMFRDLVPISKRVIELIIQILQKTESLLHEKQW